MAKIKVRRNFSFEDIIREQMPTAAEMREEAERLAVRIENRTLGGLDENNRRFAPYAASTGKPEPVSLHETSRMFADFGVIKATRKMVALGFRTKRSEDIAHYHETGAGRLPVRKFLGIPSAWAADFLRRIRRRRR